MLERGEVEIVPQLDQPLALPPRVESLHLCIAPFSNELDPETSVGQSRRKPTYSRQYPRSIDVEFME